MKCKDCEKIFSTPYNLRVHQREQHSDAKLHKCDRCGYETKRPSNLVRHKRQHNNGIFKLKVQLPQPQPLIQHRYEAEEQEALRNRLKSYRITTDERDPLNFLNNMIPQIDSYVAERLQQETGIKLQLKLSVQFYKPTDPENKEAPRGFYSRALPIFRGTEYDVADTFTRIMEQVEEHQRNGSGYAIEKVEHLDVHLLKYQPLRGSTYQEIPQQLKIKKAIINIKNDDHKCFLWSILALLHPADDRNHNRVSKYKRFENELNFNGITFPVQLKDINRFEEQKEFAVSVYSYEDYLYHLRVSDVKDKQHVHLLLFDGHYSLIKDFNRLLHDQRNHQHRMFFCPRCLQPKSKQAILDEHLKLCSTVDPTRVAMPDDTKLKFTNIQNRLRQPLVVYADFECLTKKVHLKKGSSILYQHHIPSGYGLIESLGCCEGAEFSEPTIYRGQNVVERFLVDLIGITNEHQHRIDNIIAMDRNHIIDGNVCHICKEEIIDNKVQDHCHICGNYRGPAHNSCNLNHRLNRDVVVVFHNLRRYDGHLIMQEIGQMAKLLGFEIGVIAKAMEDYLSFSLKHKKEPSEPGKPRDHSYTIKFIDSLQFLNSSLDGLVSNLEDDRFHALGSMFTGEKLELLKRKGVYPYDYMDSEQRFQEQLPSIEKFHSKLNEADIDERNYQHAQNVWKTFHIRNMGEYHDLYLQTDVLLLADVFEEFRRLSLQKYELDPCHYITTPSLTWDACMLKTGIELELFEDPDMYIFCEKGIRGGVSQISHRYAEANNPSKPNTYIPYWDANNLYGYAMSEKLPVDGFKWMDQDEIMLTDFNDCDGDVGYILEVDLGYPKELHDMHNDLPLAPEQMEITEISPYSQHLKEKFDLRLPPQTKLVPNLYDKKNYILHCQNLKLYRELGMQLTKIHRAIKFNQRAWLATYIDLNTKMRAQARSKFEKDFFKLMNSAVFGKTMENVRRYRNIELVNDEMRLEKLVANPRFNSSCRFNDHLVGVSMLKPSCRLCKRIYIGLTVLDLSKKHMYEFHYKYVVKNYGSKAKLLFTDTDSLCYLVETEDIYKDMKKDGHLFDFSDYPLHHPNYLVNNKKVIGVMKDETEGLPIEFFVGLRAKMYAIAGAGIDKKTAKGIKRSVVRKISPDEYKAALFSEEQSKHSMRQIANHDHGLYSKEMKKTSLSPYDDKRWLLNAVESRAHGHYMNDIMDMECE